MTTQQLIQALQDLKAALSALMITATENGDDADAANLQNACAQIDDALTVTAANDIMATLHDVDPSGKIATATAKIAQATKDIQSQVKSINGAVTFGTNIAAVVLNLASGQVGEAIAAGKVV